MSVVIRFSCDAPDTDGLVALLVVQLKKSDSFESVHSAASFQSADETPGVVPAAAAEKAAPTYASRQATFDRILTRNEVPRTPPLRLLPRNPRPAVQADFHWVSVHWMSSFVQLQAVCSGALVGRCAKGTEISEHLTKIMYSQSSSASCARVTRPPSHCLPPLLQLCDCRAGGDDRGHVRHRKAGRHDRRQLCHRTAGGPQPGAHRHPRLRRGEFITSIFC